MMRYILISVNITRKAVCLKKVYCVAQFLPKEGKLNELFKVLQSLEPNTIREDGCIQYIVTRHIQTPFAEGDSYPIAFNEICR